MTPQPPRIYVSEEREHAPDMDFDEVTDNIESQWGRREHVTDGSPCWCNPVTVTFAALAAQEGKE